LDNIKEGLDDVGSAFHLAGNFAPKYIYGVELVDAANMESLMHIKRVHVDQPWAHLTGEQPLVLLFKNIPAPIFPDCDNLCEDWTTAPTQQNYLVAMGLAVQSLLERREDGLAERLEWHHQNQLIKTHRPGIKIPIHHSQKLRAIRKPLSNETVRQRMESYVHSCFIFGNGKEKPCQNLTKTTPALAPAVETLNPTNTRSESSLSSSSNASAATEATSVNDSVPSTSTSDMGIQESQAFLLPHNTPSLLHPGTEFSSRTRGQANSNEKCVQVVSSEISSQRDISNGDLNVEAGMGGNESGGIQMETCKIASIQVSEESGKQRAFGKWKGKGKRLINFVGQKKA
jgi:hypothetical protein